jgi:hypothetical protein
MAISNAFSGWSWLSS